MICKVGQSTWQAGGENEAETAQRMLQTVDKTSSADHTLPKSHVISFTLTQEKAAPEIGDRVRLSGEVQLFEPAGNPGQFDARSYYHRRNVVCQLKKPRVLWKKSGNGGIRRALQRLRGALDDSCLEFWRKKMLGRWPRLHLERKHGWILM